MDKLLSLVNQLQVTDDYVSKEITEVESLSDKISEFAKVYKKNCDEIQSKSNEIENLRATEKALYSKITERENEFVEAVNEKEDLQSEFHSLSKYECFINWTEGDFFDISEFKMKLYGIQLETQYLEPTTCQAKIAFANNKFVIINVDVLQNTYDLQAMEPKINRYEEIRTLLLESGDIAGFLCHLWKFFGHRT